MKTGVGSSRRGILIIVVWGREVGVWLEAVGAGKCCDACISCFYLWFRFLLLFLWHFSFPQCVYALGEKGTAGFNEGRLSSPRTCYLLLSVLCVEVFSARLNAVWVLQLSFSGIKERHLETLYSVLSFFNVGSQNVNQMSL